MLIGWKFHTKRGEPTKWATILPARAHKAGVLLQNTWTTVPAPSSEAQAQILQRWKGRPKEQALFGMEQAGITA